MHPIKRWLASWSTAGQGRGAALLRATVYLLVALALWVLATADKPGDFADEIAALEAAGEKLDLEHHIAAGLLYAALANLVLGAAVLATRRWWARPLDPPARAAAAPAAGVGAGARWFWACLAAVLAVAAVLRADLAAGSLWWDELWNVKHTMSGEFRPDAKRGGELRFREASWDRALYYYRKPTNHPPVALASRASLATWRKLSGAPRHEFHELAVRAPSILAGLGSIAALALLLRGCGFGAGGLVAALLLAIHPWHIRYGVDARAYSFAVLWTVLGCLWLSRLLGDGRGRWRWWLLFGLNQLLLVWSLPNGVYYAAGFGVLALAGCAWRMRGAQRVAALARVAAVNVVAAMAFLFLFLPNALQIGEWGEVNDHHFLSAEVLKNVASQLAFGLQLEWDAGPEADGLASFSTAMAARPWLGWAVIALGLGAAAAGALRVARRAPALAWAFAAVAAATAVSLLVTWSLHQHFYHRYAVTYLIVPLVALVGVGACAGVRAVTRPGGARVWLAALPALALLAGYWAFTSEQRRVLSTRSYGPFREVAQFLDGQRGAHPGASFIGYGLGGRVLRVYAPEVEFGDTLGELDALLEEARARGGPVFVVHGYRQFNRIDPGAAPGAAKLDDAARFEEVFAAPGIEPLFYFTVLRERGRSD